MLLNTSMVQRKTDGFISANTAAQAKPAHKPYNDMLCAVGKGRDRKSFVEIFEYFAPRVKSFLMKGGANESQADELAQETMLTVWDKAGSYDPKQASASTWIFTIARNKRIDAFRKFKRVEIDFDDVGYTFEDGEKSPLENISATQQSEALLEAIENLPEEQADLVRKSFYEDKSHADIAEETGIALGTVKSRIRLALERLRREKRVTSL